jgi:hypothetical protein
MRSEATAAALPTSPRYCLLATVVLALAVPSCKKEAAPAARPSASPVSTAGVSTAERQRQLAEAVKQQIEDFYLAIYFHPDRWRVTGVFLNLTGKTPPIAAPGAGNVITTIRLTEPEAERLVNKLARHNLIERAWGCSLRGRPPTPYFSLGGAAGQRYEFHRDLLAGPDAEAWLAEFAAILDPEAHDAIHDMLAKIKRQGQPVSSPNPGTSRNADQQARLPSSETAQTNGNAIPQP